MAQRTEYHVVECNRATSRIDTGPLTGKWSNAADVSLKRGDRVSVEACVINSSGASNQEAVMEFTGKSVIVNGEELPYTDNHVIFELGFYMTNSPETCLNLPVQLPYAYGADDKSKHIVNNNGAFGDAFQDDDYVVVNNPKSVRNPGIAVNQSIVKYTTGTTGTAYSAAVPISPGDNFQPPTSFPGVLDQSTLRQAVGLSGIMDGASQFPCCGIGFDSSPGSIPQQVSAWNVGTNLNGVMNCPSIYQLCGFIGPLPGSGNPLSPDGIPTQAFFRCNQQAYTPAATAVTHLVISSVQYPNALTSASTEFMYLPIDSNAQNPVSQNYVPGSTPKDKYNCRITAGMQVKLKDVMTGTPATFEESVVLSVKTMRELTSSLKFDIDQYPGAGPFWNPNNTPLLFDTSGDPIDDIFNMVVIEIAPSTAILTGGTASRYSEIEGGVNGISATGVYGAPYAIGGWTDGFANDPNDLTNKARMGIGLTNASAHPTMYIGNGFATRPNNTTVDPAYEGRLDPTRAYGLGGSFLYEKNKCWGAGAKNLQGIVVNNTYDPMPQYTSYSQTDALINPNTGTATYLNVFDCPSNPNDDGASDNKNKAFTINSTAALENNAYSAANFINTKNRRNYNDGKNYIMVSPSYQGPQPLPNGSNFAPELKPMTAFVSIKITDPFITAADVCARFVEEFHKANPFIKRMNGTQQSVEFAKRNVNEVIPAFTDRFIEPAGFYAQNPSVRSNSFLNLKRYVDPIYTGPTMKCLPANLTGGINWIQNKSASSTRYVPDDDTDYLNSGILGDWSYNNHIYGNMGVKNFNKWQAGDILLRLNTWNCNIANDVLQTSPPPPLQNTSTYPQQASGIIMDSFFQFTSGGGNYTTPTFLPVGQQISFEDSGSTSNYSNQENRAVTIHCGTNAHFEIAVNNIEFEQGASSLYDRMGVTCGNSVADLILASNILSTTTAPDLSSFMYQTAVTNPETVFGTSYSGPGANGGWVFPGTNANFVSNGGVIGQFYPVNTEYIRFYFQSDTSVTKPGWQISIKSVLNANTQPPVSNNARNTAFRDIPRPVIINPQIPFKTVKAPNLFLSKASGNNTAEPLDLSERVHVFQGNVVKRNEIIVTNILYTEANISDIARAMRINEEYSLQYNSQNLSPDEQDASSEYYYEMDVGMADDSCPYNDSGATANSAVFQPNMATDAYMSFQNPLMTTIECHWHTNLAPKNAIWEATSYADADNYTALYKNDPSKLSPGYTPTYLNSAKRRPNKYTRTCPSQTYPGMGMLNNYQNTQTCGNINVFSRWQSSWETNMPETPRTGNGIKFADREYGAAFISKSDKEVNSDFYEGFNGWLNDYSLSKKYNVGAVPVTYYEGVDNDGNVIEKTVCAFVSYDTYDPEDNNTTTWKLGRIAWGDFFTFSPSFYDNPAVVPINMQQTRDTQDVFGTRGFDLDKEGVQALYKEKGEYGATEYRKPDKKKWRWNRINHVACGTSNVSFDYNPTTSRFAFSGLYNPFIPSLNDNQLDASFSASDVGQVSAAYNWAPNIYQNVAADIDRPDYVSETGIAISAQVIGQTPIPFDHSCQTVKDTIGGCYIRNIYFPPEKWQPPELETGTLGNYYDPKISQDRDTLLQTNWYESMTVDRTEANRQKIIAGLTPASKESFKGSILDKMGFTYEQWFPKFGSQENRYSIATYSQREKDVMMLGQKPLMLNQITDISDVQQLSVNGVMDCNATFSTSSTGITTDDGPLKTSLGALEQNFKNGTTSNAPVILKGLPQGALVANQMPQLYSSAYFLILSDIVTPTQFQSNEINQNAVWYAMKNYSAGDFFYSSNQDYYHTVTRDRVVNLINTEIRDPTSGRLAVLSPESVVLYKIERDFILPPLESFLPALKAVEEEDQIENIAAIYNN